MNLYTHFLRPLLFTLDAESVHHLAMKALRTGAPLMRPFVGEQDSRLARTVFGVRFRNPVGLGAGFDKDAQNLRSWEALGFGFAEVGTITARAQPGNPKPRVFRYPQQKALINRMGFNNDGADAVAARLQRVHGTRRWPRTPVGINIGKSKVAHLQEATADYLLAFERLQHFGDYFVLNISSPNTPGLRSLQDRGPLDELLSHIQRRNTTRKPVLIKIAPDLDWRGLEDILGLAEEHGVAGIVATNTTTDHSAIPSAERQQGGLSGVPLRARSTEIIRFIAQHSKLPIIGVGGIFTPDDALEKFDAGASLVQLYTGFVYEGPALIRRICEALLARGR